MVKELSVGQAEGAFNKHWSCSFPGRQDEDLKMEWKWGHRIHNFEFGEELSWVLDDCCAIIV